MPDLLKRWFRVSVFTCLCLYTVALAPWILRAAATECRASWALFGDQFCLAIYCREDFRSRWELVCVEWT